MQTAHPRTYTLSSFLIAGAIFAGVACTTVFNNSQIAHAQEVESQLALTAIPPRLGEDRSLLVKPGETTQITLRVTNSTREAMTVESLAQDFIVEDGETPIPVTEEVSNRWSLASWMVVVPNKQVVQPGQTAGVNVLIKVPEDALPGGHYAMVTHQPAVEAGLAQDEVAANQAATGVSQRVGTLVYLVVDGPINYEAFVRGFAAPDFTEYGPIPFSFTMDNRSDVHIRPQANIEIYDLLNRRAENLQVETKNVFPFTARLFEAEWPQTWGWGYYRAKLVVSFGEQGQVITDTISFWFFPIKLVIAGLIALLSLLAAGIAVRRHILHRNGDEQKRIALLEERLRAMESDKLRKYEDDTP
jgi:hypothetical protein